MTRVARALCCTLALSSLLLGSGCYTTTLRNGRPAAPAQIAFDERWHHGALLGIAELSGPYALSEACPNGWAEIETETSFLNGLLELVTGSIYSPQTVTVRCAQGSTPLPPGISP